MCKYEAGVTEALGKECTGCLSDKCERIQQAIGHAMKSSKAGGDMTAVASSDAGKAEIQALIAAGGHEFLAAHKTGIGLVFRALSVVGILRNSPQSYGYPACGTAVSKYASRAATTVCPVEIRGTRLL